MDLRKSLLKKQRNVDDCISNASLNDSNASSAPEDETVYFSCESDAEKSPNAPIDDNNNVFKSPAIDSPASDKTSRRRSSILSSKLPPTSFYSAIQRKSPSLTRSSGIPKLKLLRTKTFVSERAVKIFKCVWCDKQFKIEKALQIHLAEKCNKIPPIERKKILAN